MIPRDPERLWYDAYGPFASDRDCERATLADANRRCLTQSIKTRDTASPLALSRDIPLAGAHPRQRGFAPGSGRVRATCAARPLFDRTSTRKDAMTTTAPMTSMRHQRRQDIVGNLITLATYRMDMTLAERDVADRYEGYLSNPAWSPSILDLMSVDTIVARLKGDR